MPKTNITSQAYNVYSDSFQIYIYYLYRIFYVPLLFMRQTPEREMKLTGLVSVMHTVVIDLRGLEENHLQEKRKEKNSDVVLTTSPTDNSEKPDVLKVSIVGAVCRW